MDARLSRDRFLWKLWKIWKSWNWIFEALRLSEARFEALQRCASAQCSNNLQRRSCPLSGRHLARAGATALRTLFKHCLRRYRKKGSPTAHTLGAEALADSFVLNWLGLLLDFFFGSLLFSSLAFPSFYLSISYFICSCSLSICLSFFFLLSSVSLTLRSSTLSLHSSLVFFVSLLIFFLPCLLLLG